MVDSPLLSLNPAGPLSGAESKYMVQGSADARVTVAEIGSFIRASGNCRLDNFAGNLRLSRYNGIGVIIGGSVRLIPTTGVDLAPTGLSAGTNYYVYAYMSGSTMLLEASATTPVVDTTYGIKVKSGDPARTLVGMARPIAGPNWATSAGHLLVISYFNRLKKSVSSFLSVDANIAAPSSLTEVNSTYGTGSRIDFLTWADEAVHIFGRGGAYQSAGTAALWAAAIGLDSATVGYQGAMTWCSAGGAASLGSLQVASELAEGYHYATLLVKNPQAGSQMTFSGTNDYTNAGITAVIRG